MMGQAYTSSPILYLLCTTTLLSQVGEGGKQNQQDYLCAYTESKL